MQIETTDTPLSYAELVAIWPSMPKTKASILDASEVPEELRSLIPYAQIWGISDDINRDAMLSKTPTALRTHLKKLVIDKEEVFENWLGREHVSSPPTSAQVAFTALLIAADSI